MPVGRFSQGIKVAALSGAMANAIMNGPASTTCEDACPPPERYCAKAWSIVSDAVLAASIAAAFASAVGKATFSGTPAAIMPNAIGQADGGTLDWAKFHHADMGQKGLVNAEAVFWDPGSADAIAWAMVGMLPMNGIAESAERAKGANEA